MPYDPRVHVGVAAIVKHPTGKLLCLQRKGAHGAGTWSVPGGWIEYQETPEEAVLRELEEEVGLKSETALLLDVVSNTFETGVDTAVTVFYEIPFGTLQDQKIVEIRDPYKISALDWIHVENLIHMDLFPPLAALIEEKGQLR